MTYERAVELLEENIQATVIEGILMSEEAEKAEREWLEVQKMSVLAIKQQDIIRKHKKIDNSLKVSFLVFIIAIASTFLIYAKSTKYRQADIDRATNISIGLVEPQKEDYKIYDLNNDGKVNVQDVKKIINKSQR